MTKTLLLASQSPRRAELLTQIGVPFEVVRIDVLEQRADSELPQDYVLRLAQDKAREGARLHPDAVVLGADTIVECQGMVLEKPRDQCHAQAMLALLSGNTHKVHTAVAVCHGAELHSVLVTSLVTFRTISDDEAKRYWLTGEPCDKAGGYGIQGFGGVFVTHLEGSYSAVMGLPVAQTQQLLGQLGLPYWDTP